MKFQNFSSAGVARTRNYGYALARNNIKVIFSSFLEYDSTAILNIDPKNPNIFYYCSNRIKNEIRFKTQKKEIRNYLNQLLILANEAGGASFLLYPSTYVTFDTAVILYFKKLHNQKVFYEANEVRKYSVSSYGQIFNINYLKYALAERFMKYYDGVICISTNIQNYFLKLNKNTIIIPILSDIKNIEKLKKSYSKDLVFKIGFTGIISVEKENFKVFFEGLSILKKEQYTFRFNLYGGITEKEYIKLKKLIEKMDLSDCVVYHGKVEQKEVMKILQDQHLLVLPRKENNQNKYGFSTKLSEYLVSGTPVLLTDVSDNLFYLKEGIDVVVADFKDPNDFAYKIKVMIDNYEIDGNNLSENALIAAGQHFDYRHYSEKLSDFLLKV